MLNKIIVSFLCFSLSSLAMAEFELKSESSYNPEFNNRYTFILGLNPSLARSQDVKSFQFAYGRKIDETFWVDGFFQSTNASFRDIGENNASATGVSDVDINEASEKLTLFGVGVQYKSRYSAILLPFDLYETSTASLVYATMSEDAGGKSFSGPGLKAKFSIMKPLGNYTHIGLNMDYNLLTLKRAQDGTETSSARSLTASWLTLGFDISFFL